ncbi:MAG TPA: hypothetical protein VNT56_08630 [Acidimicrobiales bacterium]|jgi:hypothetical protein|nr:hypothetical protein [Acidimicrobiales bacterium]
MNGWNPSDPSLADDDLERWVEEDLARVADQRAASLRALADTEAWERRCLDAVLPLSAAIADAFRRTEQRTRAIRSSRHHEVVVRLRQPAVTSVRVNLRWGAKFGLTDAERALMRSYQRRPRRLFRYPEVVVAQEYHELSAVLDGDRRTLSLGTSPPLPLEQYLSSPSMVERYLQSGVARPPTVRLRHHRADGYRERRD